ncbi:MAG: DUF4062 domain-containing protein [Phycisphaerales bacterium]|nr:DUF4062 domain-containing protein [Phycisphaerales bacterium]
MAKPRIFVSSTYYDLKHVRASLDRFIQSLGFEPILSEKGEIAYHPDMPLDESCYREAISADIYLLIVGGRYGSIASSEHSKLPPSIIHERYESITKKEFDAAQSSDVPTFILVDRAVQSEYETFKRNRDLNKIKYAHVDSVNIFHFLDEIFSKKRNNPTHQFDRFTEIESWLREQWAGLFRELLTRRSSQQQLSSLANQVSQLSEVNDTLRTYLEQVVSKIDVQGAAELIQAENQKLRRSKTIAKIRGLRVFRWLNDMFGIDFEQATNFLETSSNSDDFVERVSAASSDPEFFRELMSMPLIEMEQDSPKGEFNAARKLLGLPYIFDIDKNYDENDELFSEK